jgi:hypothetical protein
MKHSAGQDEVYWYISLVYFTVPKRNKAGTWNHIPCHPMFHTKDLKIMSINEISTLSTSIAHTNTVVILNTGNDMSFLYIRMSSFSPN